MVESREAVADEILAFGDKRAKAKRLGFIVVRDALIDLMTADLQATESLSVGQIQQAVEAIEGMRTVPTLELIEVELRRRQSHDEESFIAYESGDDPHTTQSRFNDSTERLAQFYDILRAGFAGAQKMPFGILKDFVRLMDAIDQ